MERDLAIPEEECWRLLATIGVGRVALSVDALPAVLPVRYVVDGRRITMALGELQVPVTSAHHAVVAFSADDLSDDRLDGWYVHAVGTSTIEHLVQGDLGGNDHLRVVKLDPTIVRGCWLHLHLPSA